MSELFNRLKNQLRRDCQYHIVVARLEVGGYLFKVSALGLVPDTASLLPYRVPHPMGPRHPYARLRRILGFGVSVARLSLAVISMYRLGKLRGWVERASFDERIVG